MALLISSATRLAAGWLTMVPIWAMGAPTLSVTTEPTSVTLGQPIRILASVPADGLSTAAFRLIWPSGEEPARLQTAADQTGWTTWTLLHESAVNSAPNQASGNAFRYQWTLVPFAEGAIPGPIIAVVPQAPSGGALAEIRETATTVTVGGTRAQYDEEVRALRPPMVVPLPGWIWAVAGGVLLLATAGIAFLAYRWMKTRSGNAGPAHTPEEAMLLNLEQLESLELPKARRFREYFTRLSDEIRRYLDRRWEVPAPELTTYELHQRLAESTGGIPEESAKAFLAILEEADTVKFAKGQPNLDVCSRCLQQTRSAVENLAQELAHRAEQQRKAQEAGRS